MSTRDDRFDTGPDHGDAANRTTDEAETGILDERDTEQVDVTDADPTQTRADTDDREVYGVPELDDADEDDDEDYAGGDEVLPPSEMIGRVLNLAVALVVGVFVTLLAVVAPSAGATPRDVPIGMVGPENTITQLTDLLEQAQPGSYDVRTFDGAEALRAATESRDVYGGFVLEQDAPAVFVATGADGDQANVLRSLGSQLGLTNVTDVAGTTSQDPMGLGITVTAVVLALVGLIAAAGLRHQLPGRIRAQLIGAVAVSVVLGLAFSGALHGLGSVAGSFWTLAGAIALGALASTLPALGLMGLLGLAGGALWLVLVVIPGIGLGSPWNVPETVPGVWGTIGRYLPTGATDRFLESTAYFGGDGGLQPALALVGWTVLGFLLVLISALMARRAAARAAALDAALAAEAEAEEDDAADDAHDADDAADDTHDTGDDVEMPDAEDGATVGTMSEHEAQPGQSDWLRKGGADGENRPDSSGDERDGEALDASPPVHGAEGGGDPAAGAEEDAVSGPDGGHRSTREV